MAPAHLHPSMQAPPPPPRGSGFDPAQPEELELWHLQQGLAREREYHHVAKRKAGVFFCCELRERVFLVLALA